MKFTLQEIATHLGAELEGDVAQLVHGMAEITEAEASDLCFAESAKYTQAVEASAAAAFIVGPDFPGMAAKNLLRCQQPRQAFLKALELFSPSRRLEGIHPSAVLADDAQVHASSGIGPGVVLESGSVIGPGSRIRAGAYVGQGVEIGADCDIGVNVTLLDGVKVGDRCILHPGVVVGADGFGFQWLGDHHHKIPQIGGVVIGDDVEIGANCCIDRATLGITRIGSGSKLDNLVQIGHNNDIGQHVLLVSQVGIAGSCKIGNGAVLGGQVGVADHIDIGGGAQIGAQGGVTGDIEPGAKIWGTPSRPMMRVLKEQAALGKLPELLKTIKAQSRELEELKQRLLALEKAGR